MDNRLKLYSVGSTPLELLNFGSNIKIVASTDISSNLLGVMDLSFKLYLDNDSGYQDGLINISTINSSEYIGVSIVESSLYICQRKSDPHNYGFSRAYSILNKKNSVLDCVIRKTETGDTVDFFKINGISQTPGETRGIYLSYLLPNEYMYVGYSFGLVNPTAKINPLSNATIWDISVTEVSTGQVKHYWAGHPNPSSNAGWVDQVGTYDLSLFANTPTTRILNIPSTTGSNSNKIKLYGETLHVDVSTIEYGNLYNGYIPFDERGIAPLGWHIPSKTEWETLIFELGGDSSLVGGKLKEIGFTYWNNPNVTIDNSNGFSGRGAGLRYHTGSFAEQKARSIFLSSTMGGLSWPYLQYPYVIEIYAANTRVIGPSDAYQITRGSNIRLLKDNSINTGSMIDYDGNEYLTVQIGTQVWTASNLITEHFNNGDKIANVTDACTWAALTTSAMCYYNNDINNAYTYNVRGGAKENKLELYSDSDPNTVLTVESRGNGTGVTSVTLGSSSRMLLTLDGSAKFYTDASGTLGESNSTILYGIQQKYLKNPSGISNLTFYNKKYLTYAGSIASIGSYLPMTYGTANSPLIVLDNWDFPNCYSVGWGSNETFTGNISRLRGVTRGYISTPGIYGDCREIPRSLTFFSLNNATQNIYGDVSGLPPTATEIAISGSNTISGDISGLPRSSNYITIAGTNTLSGSLENLPTYLYHAYFGGFNTITGDISTLDASIINIYFMGNNTVFGDIGSFKSNEIQTIYITGNSSIYGDIKNLPDKVAYLTVYLCTISGDISTFKPAIRTVRLTGNTTLYGKVDDLPAGINVISVYGNTINGNIGNTPTSLTNCEIYGSNTITGDISTLKSALTSIYVGGNNTIYGDINFLPSANALTNLNITGVNTISGSMGATLKNKTALTTLNVYGANTISGDISNLPSNATYIDIRGNNTINAYTLGRTWPLRLRYLYIPPIAGGGLDASAMDNLFIDLNNSSCGYPGGTLYIKGTCAAPTINSSTARSTLQSRGYTITTN